MGTSTKTTSTHEGFQWISLDLTRKNADFKPSGYIVSKRKQKWINMDFINIAIVCLRLLPAISYHHRTWAMSENLVLYPKNHLLDLTGLSSFSVIDIANFGGTSTVYTCIHHFKTHPIFQTWGFFFGFLFSCPSTILQLTNFKMGPSMGTGELGCSDPSKMVSDFSVCLGNNLIYIYTYIYIYII